MPVETFYSSSVQKIVNDVKTIDEEYIIRGDKGLKIKYFKVRGNNKEKIVITAKGGENKYIVKKTVNDEVTENTVDSKGLATELKSSKLAFAKEYVKDLLSKK